MLTNNKMAGFFTKVYMWMAIGLLVSSVVSYYTSINSELLRFVYNNFKLLLIFEIIIVIFFSFLRKKVSANMAKIIFVLYSIINGFTLSSIFIVFKLDSILMVFISSALMFGLMALYGYVTKNDLTTFGKIFLFALIAVVIMSLINIFMQSSSFGITISIISIVVFLGLTAWDMQSLKAIYNYYCDNKEELNKASIYGALDLYLDFINIFLQLLNLFGKRND